MRIIASGPDKDAEQYWKEYFKDSGYGEQLTKDLPKRVAALLGKSFTPVAETLREDGTLVLEGLRRGAKGAVTLEQIELSTKNAALAPKVTSFPLRASEG